MDCFIENFTGLPGMMQFFYMLGQGKRMWKGSFQFLNKNLSITTLTLRSDILGSIDRTGKATQFLGQSVR